MERMRECSESTGLKAVPSVPSTFAARSSPHFMAALGEKEQNQRETSVYKATTSSPNPPRKHSALFHSANLPVIQVTMEEVEERKRHSGSPQRKIVSSYDPSWARGGMKAIDTKECNSSTSDITDLQRPKMSERKGESVLGDTPLGRDLIFRRKTSPDKKMDKAEEKEKLLKKYALLDNTLLNNDGKKQTKPTYFNRYNIDNASLPKGNMNSNWPARGRTQSLNFVPKLVATNIKEKTKNKIFASRTFPGGSTTNNVFTRDRAQSLNIVLQGRGSVKTKAMEERTRGLCEIMEEKRKQNISPLSTGTAESNLQADPVAKTNKLQDSLFVYPQRKVDSKLGNRLSPTRDGVYTASFRKESKDRNAFLNFPTLRSKPWTES